MIYFDNGNYYLSKQGIFFTMDVFVFFVPLFVDLSVPCGRLILTRMTDRRRGKKRSEMRFCRIGSAGSASFSPGFPCRPSLGVQEATRAQRPGARVQHFFHNENNNKTRTQPSWKSRKNFEHSIESRKQIDWLLSLQLQLQLQVGTETSDSPRQRLRVDQRRRSSRGAIKGQEARKTKTELITHKSELNSNLIWSGRIFWVGPPKKCFPIRFNF